MTQSGLIGRLQLEIAGGASVAYVPFLRRGLLKAHRILTPPLRELSIALIGDGRMAALHLQFLNIPGPTDVLTFPLDYNARGKVTSGEVVICVPEARRHCRGSDVALEQELLLYALHGMLHLCGFDDRTQRDFDRMHRTEDQILTRLGVGPVFARPAATARSGRDGSGEK